MCEICEQKAAEIDPDMFKLMDMLKEQMQQATGIAAPYMLERMEVQVVNRHTGDDSLDELNEEQRQTLEQAKENLGGLMGCGYGLGWFFMQRANSKEEEVSMAHALMEAVGKGIEDSMAWNYVKHKGKH